MFSFPQIDPIAFSLGPVDVRWYALAYMAGFILGWLMLRQIIKTYHQPLSLPQLDTLLNASLLGVIVGGRLGYVMFYQPGFYLANPLQIFALWQGGMSFHGGFLGIICAVIAVGRYYRLNILAVGDAVAMVAPIGLFFGRLANFINAELYGRVTDSAFGIVFPGAGSQPRHPSQLYEAGLEGLLLGVIMLMLWRRGWLHQHGRVTGVLLAGYGVARSMIEFVREPDAQIGLLLDSVSMGQLLSVPMIIFGAYLIMRRPASPDRPPA